MPDSYRTISRPVEAEIARVKGSRFIGAAFPVSSESEAVARLEEVRGNEKNATHHCWAWRLGPEGDITRSSDDGEPSGTAGAPILRQIVARDLTQILVVVTRYFGGTKLGTGGLVRAYGQAAAVALDAAAVVEVVRRTPIRLCFEYGDTAAVMASLHRFEAEIVDQSFGERTTLLVAVRNSAVDSIMAALTDALAGRGEIEVTPD